MLFKDVIGQDTFKEQIINMWHQKRLPHALLINGKEGLGGLAAALALSQYLFCLDKQENDACGQCVNCHKLSKMEHADMHYSFPAFATPKNDEGLSRFYIKEFRDFAISQPYGTLLDWLQYIQAENKQGNISAAECRHIIEQLNTRAYEGGLKVMLIWRIELLGKEGNVLLKLIEEPPKNTILIFVSESINNILATILSRVQVINLTPIPSVGIKNALINKIQVDDKKAQQIALLSEGSYTAALNLVEQIESDWFPLVRRWFNALFTNKGIELSLWGEELSKYGREQIKNFIQYSIHLMEACIRLRYANKSVLVDEELDFVTKLAATKLSLKQLENFIEVLTDTAGFIQRNANPKIQLQALSIKMLYIIHNKKVTSLI